MLRAASSGKTQRPTTSTCSASATGWGVNLSSNIKFEEDVLRLQVVYGEGIQNYMNDATVDIGVKDNLGSDHPDGRRGAAHVGMVAFLDHTWNEKFTSSLGGLLPEHRQHRRSADAFHPGPYAMAT